MKTLYKTKSWKSFLSDSILSKPFIGISCNCEDKNILALKSKEDYVKWFCQNPGKDGEPYRDKQFYSRELTILSNLFKPKNILEIGTDKGLGTFMLSRLNPEAEVTTIDPSSYAYTPDNNKVEIGWFAKLNNIDANYIQGESQDQEPDFFKEFDFVFVDGDHSYLAVYNDLKNTSNSKIRIVHDYQEVGTKQAIKKYMSESTGHVFFKNEDSNTIWIQRR